MVITYKGKLVDQWQGHGRPMLIDGHGEQWYRIDNEMYQNTPFIVSYCVWGCIAGDQTKCSYWTQSTAECLQLQSWTMHEGGLVLWLTFSFTSWRWLNSCFVYLRKKWLQDVLWERSNPAKAVWCPGQCSSQKLWVLAFWWMLLWHDHPS